jgi:predicted component of type VI protein secretion system
MAMMSAPTPLAQPAYEDPRPTLARLETLNAGPSKGATFVLRTPLAHVGRGAHNDVRLVDESVSETHAKLQRREDGWYVVDMESTNGTYVAGTRIRGERRLDGSPDIRFGGIKMRFTSTEAAVAPTPVAEPKGTRAIASVERPKRAPSSEQAPPTPAAGRRSVLGWVVLLVVVAAVAFFVLQGRA